MPYDQALKMWGAKRIDAEHPYSRPCAHETVTVTFIHESDGCETCGFDYAYVVIKGDTGSAILDPEDFNFGEVLREIVAAGGGTITGT